ncbi:uncharacterized protein ARMOST_03964 [Armillaria ostoyae]|uniref:Uncharacterized protein n=1 Tax=Armillaria ostoyae TaxID=47428 RepID=A0A284QW52_ARMOS|nr:uncharacterized protein ARMOST_03964 [Armillaria ostoyae]
MSLKRDQSHVYLHRSRFPEPLRVGLGSSVLTDVKESTFPSRLNSFKVSESIMTFAGFVVDGRTPRMLLRSGDNSHSVEQRQRPTIATIFRAARG